MSSFHRPLLRLVGCLVLYLVLVNILPSLHFYYNGQTQPLSLADTEAPHQEKYLSYFSHGNFFSQHEALRMAIRLGYETNRTIIIPRLRLGQPLLDRGPLLEMARQYAASDSCTEPCSWIEIPWSEVFDLHLLKDEFGIRVIERQDHGWGVNETVLQSIQPTEIAMVEVLTATSRQQQQRKAVWYTIAQWLQSFREGEKTGALRHISLLSDLTHLDARLVQLGSLSNRMFRKDIRKSEQQMALHEALTTRILVTPDKIPVITQAAAGITEKLGGPYQYTVLNIRLRKALKMSEDDQMPISARDKARIDNYMKAVVLELVANLPIDQTISATMQVQPSTLSDFVSNTPLHKHTGPERTKLLELCLAYRATVDTSYPVIYLVSDMSAALEQNHSLWEPLRDIFPCMFTKADMYRWRVINSTWAQELSRDGMPVEPLFWPILNILVASKASAFFEIPQTSLSTMIGWQLAQDEMTV